MNQEDTLNQLVTHFGWSSEQILLAQRANYKCEYCDKNLFENIDAYKLWEVDHIIPFCTAMDDFEYQGIDNKAVACRQCNVSFKGRYNAQDEIGQGKSKQEYITAIRQEISERRSKKQSDLEKIIRLFQQL